MVKRLLLLFVLSLLLLASCRQTTPTPDTSTQAAQISLTTDPQPPTIGDSTVTVTVTQQNRPLAGVTVALRGDMRHAGMRPVIADASKTDAEGKVVIPFKWSMSGDWIVSVTVTLADNSQVAQDFNITVKPQ